MTSVQVREVNQCFVDGTSASPKRRERLTEWPFPSFNVVSVCHKGPRLFVGGQSNISRVPAYCLPVCGGG